VSEGAGVRRKEVGKGMQGNEQEPAPATEKDDITFPAPSPISDISKITVNLGLSIWGGTRRKL